MVIYYHTYQYLCKVTDELSIVKTLRCIELVDKNLRRVPALEQR